MIIPANALRRLLYDFFTFDKKDFFVQGSGTGFSVSLVNRGLQPRNNVPFGLRQIDNVTIRVFAGSVTHAGGTIVPSGFSPGDTPPFLLTVSGNGYVYIYVTIDDTTGAVTDVSDPAYSGTIPSNTATTFYLVLGTFSTDGDGILTVQSYEVGSQMFEMCGGVSPLWGPI